MQDTAKTRDPAERRIRRQWAEWERKLQAYAGASYFLSMAQQALRSGGNTLGINNLDQLYFKCGQWIDLAFSSPHEPVRRAYLSKAWQAVSLYPVVIRQLKRAKIKQWHLEQKTVSAGRDDEQDPEIRRLLLRQSDLNNQLEYLRRRHGKESFAQGEKDQKIRQILIQLSDLKQKIDVLQRAIRSSRQA